METSDKHINRSVRRKALISYGRGPEEGEEVFIEKNEFNRIAPILWGFIFPVIAFILFYVGYLIWIP